MDMAHVLDGFGTRETETVVRFSLADPKNETGVVPIKESGIETLPWSVVPSHVVGVETNLRDDL